MRIGYVGSSDRLSTTTNAVNESANRPQTSNTQASQQKYNDWAKLVSEHAYPSTSTLSAPPPSAKSGSDPKVQGAVNKIFNAAANGNKLTQRERQFANALAGQPPDVVAAVRVDPRYQPLLNQFINNATVGGSAKPPQNDLEAAATWYEQAQRSLVNLTVWLTGQPSKFNGLPPSVAADVVNSPQAQALFANLNQFNPDPGRLPTPASADSLSLNFFCESKIADALGSSTPAAKQFTQQMAKQIVGAPLNMPLLGPLNVPRGEFSQYLDVKDNLGAPPSGSNNPSPALAIAIAQQLQAGGDSQDAHGIINDVSSAVDNFATSNSSTSVSVTKALSDYQQKTADLNWLIGNLGAGATQQAVQNYMNNRPAAWKRAYQQDKTILQASGQNLANDIAQLKALPKDLQTPQVHSTLKSLAGNDSVKQAIGFALANGPVSIVGSDGKQGEALANFLELNKSGGEVAKSSAELATAIAQFYVTKEVEPQLLSSLKGLTPGSAPYKAAITKALGDFMEMHPTMARLTGVNDGSINQLSSLLPANALKQSSKELESNIKDSLKQQFDKASPSLKSLALVVGSYGFYSAIKEAINDPNAGAVFGAFTQALGFTQNAAAVAGLFQKTPSEVTDLGNGDSALGHIAGKVINVGSLVTSLGSLGTDLQDGNTLGAVGSGAGLTGTALDLVPEELLGDFAQGGLDIFSDVFTFGSAAIGLGQLLFSGPPSPPSTADQLEFLNSERFGGLSQNALFDLLPQSSNPSSDAPGSSPWKLLVKYAEDKGYNLQDPTQRTAFVNWVNGLAASSDTHNTFGAIGPDGKPVDQLASLVQNLEAELDYSKGNVSNFPASNPVSDANFAKVAQANQLTDGFSGNLGPRGVFDDNYGVSNDHVVTVNPRPSDAAVVAPQSAHQIDQLLNVIGASGLPSRPAKG